MEIKNIFKLGTVAVCCFGAFVLTSCSDDDDNDAKVLNFNPANVETTVGNIDTVLIKGGTQPYEATISSQDTATVSIKSDSLFITGVGKGKATVIVTDKNKVTGNLSVTVK